MFTRRAFCYLAMTAVFTPVMKANARETMTVLKTSGCGCCLAWIKHLQAAGFSVEAKDVSMGELMKFKLKAGLKAELASCHTGQLLEYIIEGHVPAREIARLLLERPDAIGLAVPGMPMGSPGMETTGQGEPFEVLLIRKDGSTISYASYS